METRPLVIAVDDDESVRRAVQRVLTDGGFTVELFETAERAWDRLLVVGDQTDAVLTDLHLPGMDGMTLMARVKERWADLPVVVMTGDGKIVSAVEAMRGGAYDHLEKPFRSIAVVELTLKRAVDRRRLGRSHRRLENKLQRMAGPRGMIGSGPRMREVYQLIAAVGPTDATALLLGESGTGKELVARALHDNSPRSSRTFVPINCSALPDTLLESELFGYVRGAFTGAVSNRRGLFEEASGGTLFLDEVGDVSAAMQVRMLRVLQEGEIKPVGSGETRKVDVRVIAATNKDLRGAMRAGTFREDLFFRLNVVSIALPPLRERAEDIPSLALHFLGRYAKRFGKGVVGFQPAALDLLLRHSWPGNVRELENTVQRAVVLAEGDQITAEMLPQEVRGGGRGGGDAGSRSASEQTAGAPAHHLSAGETATVEGPRVDLPFGAARTDALDRFERDYLTSALEVAAGNMALAARNCQVDKSNFRRLVHKHGLDVARFRGAAR
ncbi:MAG: sigma-54 dependent transcriptional regulator [Haliangium ochraceum]